jgi:hypothetical protein
MAKFHFFIPPGFFNYRVSRPAMPNLCDPPNMVKKRAGGALHGAKALKLQRIVIRGQRVESARNA